MESSITPAENDSITPSDQEVSNPPTSNLAVIDLNLVTSMSSLAYNAYKTINDRLQAKFENEYSFPENSILVLKKFLDESLRQQIDTDLEFLAEETANESNMSI